jgi:hypothetical protein
MMGFRPINLSVPWQEGAETRWSSTSLLRHTPAASSAPAGNAVDDDIVQVRVKALAARIGRSRVPVTGAHHFQAF